MFSSRLLKLAFFLAVALAAAGCGSREPEHRGASSEAPVAVKTVILQPQEIPAGFEVTATVRSRTVAVLASKIMGYVVRVHADVGDVVSAGRTLIEIDSRDLDAGVQQAEGAVSEARTALQETEQAIASAKAGLELAETTYRRMKDLFEKKSVTNQEYDEAAARYQMARAGYEAALSKRRQVEAKLQQAEAAFRSAQVMKGYAVIQAPFAGVVTERNVQPGNLAAPGQPLLVLEQMSAYRLEAPVEESRLGSVRVGQKVIVRLDALGREMEASVSELVPAVDALSRTFIARINLPSGLAVRSGMFARVRFLTGSRRTLVAPAEAVYRQGQVEGVFVVQAGAARLRLVSLGAETAGGREVLSGLKEGERIVASLAPGLADGRRVEVKP